MSIGKGPRSAAVLAICLALVLPPSAAAQGRSGEKPAGEATPLTLAGAGREFLRDAGRIWGAPARMKTRDIAPLLAIAATAAFLVSADERTRDSIQGYADRHPWVGDVGPVVTLMGNEAAWGTAGAFFGLGLLLKDARARDTGYLAAAAMAQAFLVDGIMKGVAGRQRPYFEDGVDRWWGPAGFFKRFESGMSAKYVSFPSGHTTKAFALATVVALQYRHTGWVPAVAYAVATGVGLSRMTMDKHWSSDVFCGAVLGHAIARLVVRNHDRPGRLVPMLACSRGGVALSIVYDLGPAGF
jgi:membrane-associated phospholipid phosphatase